MDELQDTYRRALAHVDSMDQHLANWQSEGGQNEDAGSGGLGLTARINDAIGGGIRAVGSGLGRGIDAGIDAARSGLDAVTPSHDTMQGFYRYMEDMGTRPGELPVSLRRQQIMQEFADKREQTARQIRQDAEAKRQHNWGIAEKLISTGNMDALQEFGKQFPDVMPIVQGVSKQHLSALPVLAKGGYLPDDIVKRVMNPEPNDAPMTPGELSMHVKLGMENWQADVKEQAKQVVLTKALNTPAAQRLPHQQLLVDEHQQKLEVQKADVELKKAQAAKALRESQMGPPDHSTINQISKSLHGSPFDMTTQAQQQQTIAKYATMRPEAQQQVTSSIPVGQTGKAQEFRDPVTGQAAPSWATPQQLADLGFVNIETSQIAAVNGIRNVDAAMKEIQTAGASLLRKESGTGNFAEIPRGLLQMPIVNLIRKYSGNPDAAVLDSAIKRISPTLAKLSGDTGNIALAEQQLYASSIFSDSDTLESLHRKIQSIQEAQARTRAALGFVPDEKSYMRRLIIQGKTDDQIKATMAERSRYR